MFQLLLKSRQRIVGFKGPISKEGVKKEREMGGRGEGMTMEGKAGDPRVGSHPTSEIVKNTRIAELI